MMKVENITVDNKLIVNQIILHLSILDSSDNSQFYFRAMKGRYIKSVSNHESNWQEKLISLISQGYQLFVTVNETDDKGLKAENITKVRAFFLDLDKTDQDNLAIIEGMPIPPNLVVNTSKGKFHCYWDVIDCPLDQFTRIQKALAAKYNGDANVSDLPRIMRLAGSYNLKKKPHQVTVISHHDEACTLGEFTQAINIGSFGSADIECFDKKNSEQPINRNDGIEHQISNINRGESLHDSLLSLAGYLANDGMCANSITLYLQSQMKISNAEKDDRYAERYNDIPRMVGYVTKGKQTAAANSYWPAPTPLISELKPVLPLNVELLPKVMRDLVSDSAERMQCPPDFLAAGLVVVASSIVARNIVVQPKKYDTAWLEVPNLWGVIIGKPSLLKSPTLSIAMTALDKLENISRELHIEELKEFNVECDLSEFKASANKTKAKSLMGKKDATMSDRNEAKAILMADQMEDDEPPTQARYILNDGTFEKTADLQCTNTKGILVFRDELSGWFNNLNKPDKTNDLSFYLESWNGNKPYTVDRIGRGTTVIPNNRLSILGGIQPDIFSKLISQTVSGSQGGDGLLQRFQIAVYPDLIDKPSFIDKAPNKLAKTLFENKMLSLAKWSDEQEEQLVVKLSSEAYKHYQEWHQTNEALLRDENTPVYLEAHFAKYRGFVPCIAAIFHALDNENFAIDSKISATTMHAAITYVEYLRSHAERIYALPEQYTLAGARTILKNFDKLKDAFLVRDIYRKKWKGLTSKELVEPALAILEEAGYCMPFEPDIKSAGRPTSFFVKHPNYQLPKLTKLTTDNNNGEVIHERTNH